MMRETLTIVFKENVYDWRTRADKAIARVTFKERKSVYDCRRAKVHSLSMNH